MRARLRDTRCHSVAMGLGRPSQRTWLSGQSFSAHSLLGFPAPSFPVTPTALHTPCVSSRRLSWSFRYNCMCVMNSHHVPPWPRHRSHEGWVGPPGASCPGSWTRGGVVPPTGRACAGGGGQGEGVRAEGRVKSRAWIDPRPHGLLNRESSDTVTMISLVFGARPMEKSVIIK